MKYIIAGILISAGFFGTTQTLSSKTDKAPHKIENNEIPIEHLEFSPMFITPSKNNHSL